MTDPKPPEFVDDVLSDDPALGALPIDRWALTIRLSVITIRAFSLARSA